MFGNFEMSEAISAAQVQVTDETSALLAGIHNAATGGAAGAHVLTPPVRMALLGVEPESTYAAFLFDGQTGEPRGLSMVVVGERSLCGHDECPRVAEAFSATDPAEDTSNGNAIDETVREELLLSIASAAGAGIDPTVTTILADGRFTAQIRRIA